MKVKLLKRACVFVLALTALGFFPFLFGNDWLGSILEAIVEAPFIVYAFGLYERWNNLYKRCEMNINAPPWLYLMVVFLCLIAVWFLSNLIPAYEYLWAGLGVGIMLIASLIPFPKEPPPQRPRKADESDEPRYMTQVWWQWSDEESNHLQRMINNKHKDERHEGS